MMFNRFSLQNSRIMLATRNTV